jgi:ABC-type nitrate/sulfonate/bicarbonate transport system substrate-binding protein
MSRLKMSIGAAVLGLAFSAAAPAQNAGAQDTGKVVLGWTADLQTAPVAIALEKGFFKEAGLEVNSVRFVAGRAALEALLGGQLDLAFMAEYPPTIAALRKQEFGVVTTLSKYTGNRIISTSAVGFRSMKDLEGKKIGTTMGTNSAFFTELLVEKAGIKATIVNVSPADVVPALVRGDIDAGVTFPDFYPKAAEALGDKYREEINKDYIATFVISASPAMLTKRPGDLKKFLSGLIKAEAFIHQNPAGARDALFQAMKGTHTLAAIEKSWPDFVYTIGLDKDLLQLMAQEGEWIIKRGLIKDAQASPALFRSYLVDGPMKAIDPKRVNLPN